MKRLITALAVLALSAWLAACGGQSAANPGPSVTVDWAPEVALSASTIYAATLAPSAAPGGVIAFKSICDGRVRTLSAYRFAGLEGPGAAVVSVDRSGIDASWTLPGSGTWLKHRRAPLAEDSRALTTGWVGATVGPEYLQGEQLLWAQERSPDAAPAAGSLPLDFAALVRESRRHPSRTVYCLTLQLKAP